MDKAELVKLALEAKNADPWWSRSSDGLWIAHIAIKGKLVCRPHRPAGIKTVMTPRITPCAECMDMLKVNNLKAWRRMSRESMREIESLGEIELKVRIAKPSHQRITKS